MPTSIKLQCIGIATSDGLIAAKRSDRIAHHAHCNCRKSSCVCNLLWVMTDGDHYQHEDDDEDDDLALMHGC